MASIEVCTFFVGQVPISSMEQLGRQSKILYSFVNDSIASSYFYNMNEAEKTLYKSVNIHAINHQRTVFLNLVLPADSTSHYLLNILLGLTLGPWANSQLWGNLTQQEKKLHVILNFKTRFYLIISSVANLSLANRILTHIHRRWHQCAKLELIMQIKHEHEK